MIDIDEATALLFTLIAVTTNHAESKLIVDVEKISDKADTTSALVTAPNNRSRSKCHI